VLTRLDAKGYLPLFNIALQIVESATFPLEEFLQSTNTLQLQPQVPNPDPAYNQPAAVFALQGAVESGNGKSCYNYNIGNITTVSGDYFLNPDTDTIHKYKVYLTPLQSAVDHVSMVKRRWPDAYKAAYLGSLDFFVRGLRTGEQGGYAESKPETYVAALRSRIELLGVGDIVSGPYPEGMPKP
jgi:hypothetical protein